MNARLIPVIVALLLAALSHGLAWRFGQVSERQTWLLKAATRERDAVAANLAAFAAESERLHGLSVLLDSRIETLAAIRPKIVERYTHEKMVNPLPADCRIDAARLRIINDAISRANTASTGNPDKTVPADSAAGDG